MKAHSTAVISGVLEFGVCRVFTSGFERPMSNLFDVMRMCALCGGEDKLQGLAVLLLLPLAPLMCGYVSILLCGQMRLQQSVSSCCVEINGHVFKFTNVLGSGLATQLHHCITLECAG